MCLTVHSCPSHTTAKEPTDEIKTVHISDDKFKVQRSLTLTSEEAIIRKFCVLMWAYIYEFGSEKICQ